MATKSFGVNVTVGGNAIGELTDVNVGGVDVNMIDVTSHDSDGGWKEFLGGLKDGGTIELTGNFVAGDVGQDYLLDNPGEEAAVVVTFSSGANVTCQAIVGPYNITNPLDDKIGFTASLKVTGPITLAAAWYLTGS